MTNKEIIAYEVMDIVELLRAGWDECCQDDLDTAANLIESLRREVENLTSQLAEREREREEIKFSQVAFDEVVRIGKDLSEQLATVMKECDEYRVNYKATKVQLENANETLATVTAERDEAVDAVRKLSEGQPFNAVVAADITRRGLEQLAAVTKERDELVADAKRYRWLRSKVQPNGVAAIYWAFPSVYNSSTYWCEQSFDNSIDALAKLGAGKTGDGS